MSTSIIDPNNSSTTLLTNGTSFTGTWTDVSAWPSIIVSVATDRDDTIVNARFSLIEIRDKDA